MCCEINIIKWMPCWAAWGKTGSMNSDRVKHWFTFSYLNPVGYGCNFRRSASPLELKNSFNCYETFYVCLFESGNTPGKEADTYIPSTNFLKWTDTKKGFLSTAGSNRQPVGQESKLLTIVSRLLKLLICSCRTIHQFRIDCVSPFKGHLVFDSDTFSSFK